MSKFVLREDPAPLPEEATHMEGRVLDALDFLMTHEFVDSAHRMEIRVSGLQAMVAYKYGDRIEDITIAIRHLIRWNYLTLIQGTGMTAGPKLLERYTEE